MNEEIKENSTAEKKNENKCFKSSWPKALSWVALVMSMVVPLVALGLSIMCISNAKEDEKKEVTIICLIAIVVVAVLTINDVLIQLF